MKKQEKGRSFRDAKKEKNWENVGNLWQKQEALKIFRHSFGD